MTEETKDTEQEPTGEIPGGTDYVELAEVQAKAAEANVKENERLRKEVAKDREKARKDAEKS